MKNYLALKSMMLYTQPGIVLPKGDRNGFGNAVFMLNPDRDSVVTDLNSGFINYKVGLYKNYLIDFIYKDKIGFKKYVKNNTGVFKKEYVDKDNPLPLRLVTNSNKVNILKRNLNLLVNLGEWNTIYFNYQVRSSLEKICRDYIQFISQKVNDEQYKGYKKVLFINTDNWLRGNVLSFERKRLTNPIAIFLIALYKFPELITPLNNCDFVFTSTSDKKIMKISGNDMTKKNYTHIKQRLMNLINKDSIDETVLNETLLEGTIQHDTNNPITNAMNVEKETKHAEVKEKVLSTLSKNLLGNTVDDLTEEIDDSDMSDIIVDDDKTNEIKTIASQYLDDHPELLEEDENIIIDEVAEEIKKRYYVKEFQPKYSNEKLEEIQKLTKIQASAIGDMNESIQDLESKTIDESDFSDSITTGNVDILKAKFTNFAKSYNEKKLQKDIDNSVGQLSNASVKVFVTDKKEEDSSTPLDLKKTLTYNLKDENGNEMKLKFDVPIIYDDHFMMIKGNKKVIQNTLILKPIVKTGKDTVQIATNYKKIFIRRQGSLDVKTNALFNYINRNKDDFRVVNGNSIVTNKRYKSTLEYNTFAKKMTRFTIGNNEIILDSELLFETLNKMKINYKNVDLTKNIILGFDTSSKKLITMSINDSFSDKIISLLNEKDINNIEKLSKKSNGSNKLMYTAAKIMQKDVPLILLLCYFEGFSEIMKRAGIEYEILSEEDDISDIDLYEWGLTPMGDGYIKWKRYPSENSMLMNGLNSLPTHLYSIKDLDSKDTYMYLLTNIYNYANQSFNLDQFYDFMIDPISKEILLDMKLPTNLVDLLILSNKMLKSDEATPESDLSVMRLRSNEIIAYHVYNAIADAYRTYRRSQHKRKPDPITVPRDVVIKKLVKQPASTMNDASSLNPIFEITKLRSVTYKGEGGTNKDHALKLNLRAYNESMLGVLGITTANDSNVGVNRQLTLEPNITSTRGYIDIAGKQNVEELSTANLLTPSELLTPLGVQHDDPARTCMAAKQSMAMVLVEDSDPVLIGNGVEKVLPYHLSSDFCITADDDGEVVDMSGSMIVVKYNNGKYRTIDTSTQFKKNSSAGFYIESHLRCDKKPGDKVKKNEVIAWDNRAFAKTDDSIGASMRLGPLVKVAIIPEWDIYEDSAPITHGASEKMATQMVMPVEVTLDKQAYVSKMLKVGDKVNAGESVIVFDNYGESDDIREYMNALRDSGAESVIESSKTTKKSHYTGTVADIKVVSTVPLEELSDSLKKIVGDYWKKLKKKDNFLDKYSNSDDLAYYKSGNVITEKPGPVRPDAQGKIKGKKVGDGVLITFYISFKDVMSRGDKLASQFALKSINSHVIDKGLEPYSEYRPDENIDLITAPLSISARKTPSIFLAMFGNKLLMEAKRQMK